MRRLRTERREAAKKEFRRSEAERKVRERAVKALEHAARVAEQAAQLVVRLVSNWWSPPLNESECKAILQGQHPEWDELKIHTNYVWLLAQADHAQININQFVLSDVSMGGITLAQERRAIFYECYQVAQDGTSLPDLLKVADTADAVVSLKDVPRIAAHNADPSWQRNVIQDSTDHARNSWARGDRIYEAVRAKPII